MERLLVTGVNFPLGGNLAFRLANRFSVLGAYGRQAVEASGLQTAQVRAARHRQLRTARPMVAATMDHPLRAAGGVELGVGPACVGGRA